MLSRNRKSDDSLIVYLDRALVSTGSRFIPRRGSGLPPQLCCWVADLREAADAKACESMMFG